MTAAPTGPTHAGCRVKMNEDRARAVLVSSADRPFKGDGETFDPAGSDAALDFDGGDRLELPALGSMLIEHLLELNWLKPHRRRWLRVLQVGRIGWHR